MGRQLLSERVSAASADIGVQRIAVTDDLGLEGALGKLGSSQLLLLALEFVSEFFLVL